MTSMTGYAYEEKNYENAVVSVEIKSVNSRFLDLTLNLPPYLNPLESYFRNKITEKVARGKVDVYIRVKLDTENYRERREQKLKSLARNIAHKVKKTRKPVSLEPMNRF